MVSWGHAQKISSVYFIRLISLMHDDGFVDEQSGTEVDVERSHI